MPYAHLNKYVGKRHGGDVKAYQAGGVTFERAFKDARNRAMLEDRDPDKELFTWRGKSYRANMAKPKAAAPKIVDYGDEVRRLQKRYSPPSSDMDTETPQRDVVGEKAARKAASDAGFQAYEYNRAGGHIKNHAKYVGKRHGGDVKAYQAGGVTDENFLKQRREDIAARKAAADADAEAVRLAKAKRVYDRSVRRYENEVESERNSPANRFLIGASDSVGDFIRGVGKRLGTNRTLSQDDEAQMQARRDVRGYKKGGGIEKRGKTRGAIVRMAAGGSVSARADGIAQRGKTRCKMV